MMKICIYLAGYIQGSVLKECISWRKRIREHYDNWKGAGVAYPIIWMDPLNGEEKVSDDGLTSSVPPQGIFTRDYQCVKRADILIVNTDTFGENRPLLGTIFEMAWAFEHHVPVIMITKDTMYREHPFLKNNISWYVESVEELLTKKFDGDILPINFFYKGWTSAKY